MRVNVPEPPSINIPSLSNRHKGFSEFTQLQTLYTALPEASRPSAHLLSATPLALRRIPNFTDFVLVANAATSPDRQGRWPSSV